jgi:hypothetical protein
VVHFIPDEIKVSKDVTNAGSLKTVDGDCRSSDVRRLAFQQTLGTHPLKKQCWPIGDRQWIGLANAEAMAYSCINMELCGYVEAA